MFLVGTVYCKILWCCIEKKIYHTVNDKFCAYFVSRRLYCVLQLVLIFQYYTCCFYICIAIGDPVIKRAVGIPLTGLTPPHFSVCPKPRPGFPVWYVVVVFVFSYYLRWEVRGQRWLYVLLILGDYHWLNCFCVQLFIWGERWLFVLLILGDYHWLNCLKFIIRIYNYLYIMQSVLITNNIMSLNPAHGEVYLIQHYVIKDVSDLRLVGGFLQFPPPIKLTAMI